MNADQPTRPPRTARWIRIVLGLSLAMNLLVVGLAIGVAIRIDGKKDKAWVPPPIGAVLFKEMPREDRKALHQEVFGAREGRRDRRLQDAQGVYEALKAVPYDPEPIRVVLEAQSDDMRRFQTSLREAWLERLSKMSDAERAVYAERFWERMNKRPHDKHPPKGH